jgi:hypothetical protein
MLSTNRHHDPAHKADELKTDGPCRCWFCAVAQGLGLSSWGKRHYNRRVRRQRRAFEKHWATLTTLDDFREQLRASDPNFEENYRLAKLERQKELKELEARGIIETSNETRP